MKGGALRGALTDTLAADFQRLQDALEPAPTFREFLESPEYCGPYVGSIELSPAILAIAEAADGLPVTAIDEAQCATLFRCSLAELPSEPPRTVVVNAGRRGGKTSNLLAPKCVHAAWTVPLPNLRPGEIARAVIIASEVDLAEAAFNYCKGIVESSPRLRRALAKPITAEQILLRRPDGHLVEIVVGAASRRGGTAARSRSLVFVGLDEAAFFFSDDGHTVNDQAIYDAAKGTIKFLRGTQIWLVSTPWIEGEGLMEQKIEQHWGRPGDVLVAARVSSYALRGIPDDGSLREDDDDEETYRREILSIPLPPGARAFFPAAQLAAALEAVPPATPPDQKGAGGDFAFERDAAAAAVVGRWLGLFAPIAVEERAATPGDDKAQTATVRELGQLIAGEGLSSVMADAHRRAFVREHLELERVWFEDAPGGADGKATTYGALKRVIEEKRFALGHLDRELAERIVAQLRAVVTRPLPGGGFKIYVPRSKATKLRAGQHGDIVSALVLAAWKAGARDTATQWERPPPGKTRFTDGPSPSGGEHRGGALPWLRRSSPGHSPWLRRR